MDSPTAAADVETLEVIVNNALTHRVIGDAQFAAAKADLVAKLSDVLVSVRADAVAAERARIEAAIQALEAPHRVKLRGLLAARPGYWEHWVIDAQRLPADAYMAAARVVRPPLPAAVKCCCDGATYFTDEENENRLPFLRNPACQVQHRTWAGAT